MNRRGVSFWVHSTAGLVLAVYAVVIGLTGAVLTFHDELTERASQEICTASVGTNSRTVSADEALAAMRNAYPDGNFLSLTYPNAALRELERVSAWVAVTAGECGCGNGQDRRSSSHRCGLAGMAGVAAHQSADGAPWARGERKRGDRPGSADRHRVHRMVARLGEIHGRVPPASRRELGQMDLANARRDGRGAGDFSDWIFDLGRVFRLVSAGDRCSWAWSFRRRESWMQSCCRRRN